MAAPRIIALLLLLSSLLHLGIDLEIPAGAPERDAISAPVLKIGAKLPLLRSDPGRVDPGSTPREPGDLTFARAGHLLEPGPIATGPGGIPSDPPHPPSCRPFAEHLPYFPTAPPAQS